MKLLHSHLVLGCSAILLAGLTDYALSFPAAHCSGSTNSSSVIADSDPAVPNSGSESGSTGESTMTETGSKDSGVGSTISGTGPTESGGESTISGTGPTESGGESTKADKESTESGKGSTKSSSVLEDSEPAAPNSGSESGSTGESTMTETESKESGVGSTISGTGLTESGGESTKADKESTESGTGSTNSGTRPTESCGESAKTDKESTESSTGSTNSGTRSTESGGESTKADKESTDSGTRSTNSGTRPTESSGESTKTDKELTESGTGSTEISFSTKYSDSSSSDNSNSMTTEPVEVTTPEKALNIKQILEQIQQKLREIMELVEKLKSLFSIITTTSGALSAGFSITVAPDITIASVASDSERLASTIESETLKAEESLDICNVAANEACSKLKAVIVSVENFTRFFDPKGDVSTSDLTKITQTTSSLNDTVTMVTKDPSGVNPEALNTTLASVEKLISSAWTRISEEIQDLNDTGTNNTLAIVLGTLGGLVAVAIIATLVIRMKKKKCQRK